uniref:Uncharacterized protein n=1 Tax=Strongyloides stercoralis TaxID=6248 RepID=A0AAF5DRG9_STRER
IKIIEILSRNLIILYILPSIYNIFELNDVDIQSNKVLEFFDKINEKKRNKIINFLDKLILINISFNIYKLFKNLSIISFYVSKEIVINICIYNMIYILLFQYVVYKKGIKNKESSTAFVNFYQHILSDLDHYFDVFQKFIDIFYDMKYGEVICFFTILFLPKLKEFIGDGFKLFLCKESVTLNYKMKLNYSIEIDVRIGKLYNRTRQQTTITEKLEPVTNIFNNINFYLVENKKHF